MINISQRFPVKTKKLLIVYYTWTVNVYNRLNHDMLLLVLYKCITYENGRALLDYLDKSRLEWTKINPFK